MIANTFLSSADFLLVRRLELGHADSGVSYARACQERFPGTPAVVEQIAGGWAIFQGVDSPQTQALAIGMSGPVTGEEFSKLLEFYHSRDSAAILDLATMADASVISALGNHVVVIREISNVLARRLQPEDAIPESPPGGVEEAPTGESREWGSLVLRAFTGEEQPSPQQLDLISATPPNFRSYFGKQEGRRVAAAAMGVREGLVTLFGDATLPAARSSGLQLKLIHHRLIQAQAMGCDLASASVSPGGISHRNYERAGFRLVYSRIQVAIAK